MKLTTGIVAISMMVGGAWAQNPSAIDNARSTAKTLQQQQASDSSPAQRTAATTAKPAPGAPAPAVKPAVIPASKPVSSAPPAAEKSAHASAHNQLQKVNVVPGADSVQIEITSSQPVTPRVSKMKSPARVVIELPETVIASSQSKIAVGSAGVKGVRIGMDGKTPPTTSVVVDLEKPLGYELTPGAAGKVILTLHGEDVSASAAKNNAPAPVKAAPTTVAKVSAPAPASKAPASTTVPVAKNAAQPLPSPMASKAPKVAAVATPAKKSATQSTQVDAKQQAKAGPAPKIAAPPAPAAVPTKAPAAVAAKPKPEEKKWSMTGTRDPFFSPVVQQRGSGCATGKKCLEIGAINLRGVVKSDTGFIAVVTNNLNKAYFLRENDPVFNGYVVKITGDSVVFQETIQDKLGKSFTREVVKKIFTPAV